MAPSRCCSIIPAMVVLLIAAATRQFLQDFATSSTGAGNPLDQDAKNRWYRFVAPLSPTSYGHVTNSANASSEGPKGYGLASCYSLAPFTYGATRARLWSPCAPDGY